MRRRLLLVVGKEELHVGAPEFSRNSDARPPGRGAPKRNGELRPHVQSASS